MAPVPGDRGRAVVVGTGDVFPTWNGQGVEPPDPLMDQIDPSACSPGEADLKAGARNRGREGQQA